MISSTIELAGVIKNEAELSFGSSSGIFFKVVVAVVVAVDVEMTRDECIDVERDAGRAALLCDEDVGRTFRLIAEAIIGIDVVSGVERFDGE